MHASMRNKSHNESQSIRNLIQSSIFVVCLKSTELPFLGIIVRSSCKDPFTHFALRENVS
jgi:hypothetical protein